jgi:hypothetical protein
MVLPHIGECRQQPSLPSLVKPWPKSKSGVCPVVARLGGRSSGRSSTGDAVVPDNAIGSCRSTRGTMNVVLRPMRAPTLNSQRSRLIYFFFSGTLVVQAVNLPNGMSLIEHWGARPSRCEIPFELNRRGRLGARRPKVHTLRLWDASHPLHLPSAPTRKRGPRTACQGSPRGRRDPSLRTHCARGRARGLGLHCRAQPEVPICRRRCALRRRSGNTELPLTTSEVPTWVRRGNAIVAAPREVRGSSSRSRHEQTM